jgi:hypothetical protein
MEQYKQTLKISAPISPYADDNIYPTHLAKFGKGGYRTAATLEERDNIPDERREEGMVVFVQEDQILWCLQGGVTNDCWVDLEKAIDRGYGRWIISTTEPSTGFTDKSFWFDPSTGDIHYRDVDNTEWKLFIPTLVDGGEF